MRQFIVMDSGPLALILHKPGLAEADQCRNWFETHIATGSQFFLPEIVDYELRRELLRLCLFKALRGLDEFALLPTNKLSPVTSKDLRSAAELWAKATQQGRPTADHHALDIDMIICAQVLNTKFPSPPTIATSKMKHLSQFVDAREWSAI